MLNTPTDTMSHSPATLDAESCYLALSARDTRFDGLFFTAVKTTGIYCRPVCSARTPRRSSCLFFQTAAAAEQAGFRPCLRCRPELAPGRQFHPGALHDSLAEAILARLQAGALDEAGSETLAREIGLSSRQVRRILVDAFGVTPIEVAQTQRLLFAKKLLQETQLPIAQVALSSGFGSIRRFNDLFSGRYGMPPSALRRAESPEAEPTGRRALLEARRPASDVTLRLVYRPPYAWEALLDYLRGRATPGVEAVSGTGTSASYWRNVQLRLNGQTHSGWVMVRRQRDVEALEVTLSASLAPVLLPAVQRLRAIFDLDANPAAIAAHLQTDPLLAPVVAHVPGLRLPGAWCPFELALRAVLGQQISVAGATTLSGRMAARFGTESAAPPGMPQLNRYAPTAETLASASLDDVAAIGMPQKRAATVIALARYAATGGLDFRPGTSMENAMQSMTALPGIGPWTAQYVSMRALRYPDAFPVGDLGLRKALATLTNPADKTPIAEKILLHHAEAWRPWRAYAAIYLWQSLHMPAAETPAPTPPAAEG